MGSTLLLKNFLPSVFLLLYGSVVIAQDDPLFGDPQEKDALYALKASFRDPFLDGNWTGPHCDINQPWYGIQCRLVDGRVTEILLEDMGLSGEVNSDEFINFPELSLLSFKNNSLWGNVMNFSSNQNLKGIDLSRNMFSGPISDSLLGLNFLESLQLQDNFLKGNIPEFNQSTLKVFNVSNNFLSGQIPTTQALQSFDNGSYIGNNELCGPPSPTACNSPSKKDKAGGSPNDSSSPPPAASDQKDSSTSPINATSFIFNVVLLIAVVLLFILYYTKAKKLQKLLKEKINITEETDGQDDQKIMVAAGERRAAGEERGNLIFMQDEARFEFSDLLRASAEGLGKGIFGNSYMAKLDGGPSVVVKRLRDLKPLTSEEFAMQLRLIADLKHPNLLPLLACYHCSEEKLLLYKYAENGNLFNRIHGERRIPFKWSARLSVARGVARALEFLHLNTKSQTIVPHGNLKSSNVLLDENDTVLVSDYGLASLVALPIATQRMVSYKSPEYQTTKRVSKQTDVWSYGCLLLELLTGKIPATSAPPGINGVQLYSWIHRALREEWTAEVFDPELSRQRGAAPGMLRLLQIAMRCCDKAPEERPEMAEVVREVEHIKAPDQSEDEDDSLSLDRSTNDDLSITTTATGIVGDDER